MVIRISFDEEDESPDWAKVISRKPDAGDLSALDDASLLRHHITLLATWNNRHPMDAVYAQRI